VEAAAGIGAHRRYEGKRRACRRGVRAVLGDETPATRSEPVLEEVFSVKRGYFTFIKKQSFRDGWTASAVSARATDDRGKVDHSTRDAMWISLFTLACGAAVCRSVAAILMERGGQRPLRW